MDADGTKDGYDLEMTRGGERGGRRSRSWPAAGRASRSTWPTRLRWARPTPPWRPASSTSASTRSQRRKRIMAERGIPVRLDDWRADDQLVSRADSQSAASSRRRSRQRADPIMAKPIDAIETQLQVNRASELEIDKLFRACVKLEGQRLAPEGRQAADGPRRRHAAADEPRADRRRGNGAALLPADERAQPQDLRRRRRGRLRPHARGRRRRPGGSASTCCSSWGTSAWSPAA